MMVTSTRLEAISMDDKITTHYELRDKAGGLVSTGEVYVYDDGRGGWSYTIPESIRDLPAGDYVFSIGELGLEMAIIDPSSVPGGWGK